MQLTVNQRFTLFLDLKKVNQKTFCEVTGMLPATVSYIASGRTDKPKSDFFEALLRFYPELNLRWLLLGEEPMLLTETMENTNTLREPDGGSYGKQGDLMKLVQQLTKMLEAEQERSRKLEERLERLEMEQLTQRKQIERLGEKG